MERDAIDLGKEKVFRLFLTIFSSYPIWYAVSICGYYC